MVGIGPRDDGWAQLSHSQSRSVLNWRVNRNQFCLWLSFWGRTWNGGSGNSGCPCNLPLVSLLLPVGFGGLAVSLQLPVGFGGWRVPLWLPFGFGGWRFPFGFLLVLKIYCGFCLAWFPSKGGGGVQNRNRSQRRPFFITPTKGSSFLRNTHKGQATAVLWSCLNLKVPIPMLTTWAFTGMQHIWHGCGSLILLVCSGKADGRVLNQVGQEREPWKLLQFN